MLLQQYTGNPLVKIMLFTLNQKLSQCSLPFPIVGGAVEIGW